MVPEQPSQIDSLMNGQGAAPGRPFVAKLCTRLRYRHREGRGVRLTPSLSRPTRIRRQVAYRVVRAPHSKRHASFEIAGQCHRERFGALKHHLASCSYGRQCFPLRVALRRLYQVEREIPSARHGRAALRLGMIPCALRQHSERNRSFSRRSSAVMIFLSSRQYERPPGRARHFW